jgi:hypothetical protein
MLIPLSKEDLKVMPVTDCIDSLDRDWNANLALHRTLY